MTCENPILLIAFNRPESTKVVLDKIRTVQPKRLYIAIDGPRNNRPEDLIKVENVKQICSNIDWDCSVSTLFQKENLGCKYAVSSAINWFFANEEQGIILEDDCDPEISFFRFCDDLLEYYANDHRIGQISGSNFTYLPKWNSSYYYSKYADIWGWATWRRAWRLYDIDMTDWEQWRNSGGLSRLSGSTPGFRDYWERIFHYTHKGLVDTWDYQWMYTCWKHGLVSVLPSVTQIKNIGFDDDATHTSGETPNYIKQTFPLAFPLQHPSDIELNDHFERKFANARYHINFITDLSSIFFRIPILGPVIVSKLRYFSGMIRNLFS
jgi:hypothetical protein